MNDGMIQSKLFLTTVTLLAENWKRDQVFLYTNIVNLDILEPAHFSETNESKIDIYLCLGQL